MGDYSKHYNDCDWLHRHTRFDNLNTNASYVSACVSRTKEKRDVYLFGLYLWPHLQVLLWSANNIQPIWQTDSHWVDAATSVHIEQEQHLTANTTADALHLQTSEMSSQWIFLFYLVWAGEDADTAAVTDMLIHLCFSHQTTYNKFYPYARLMCIWLKK